MTTQLAEKPVDDARAESLGLSKAEVALARKLLGRNPTWTEFGIFAVMWSEHCSYKSSKRLLRTLPTQGEFVLEGPGENAGIIALDDEWAIAFKIESHNHPSAIEPLQGAATGVGGILRDIFTMGARPIALLDSLHFGDPQGRGECRESPGRDGAADPRPEAEASATTRRLVRGVVKGIADYGNCVGVPTVGGETHFDPSYRGNPLVNVMAIGTVKRDRIIRARASSPGARVLYYGGPTGRDGIHGATFSSETFEEGAEDRRSAVQIGDPFMEKKILEATLELIEANACEAIQDMGAAGLTCSSCEMASRGGTGIRLDLEKVPRRATGLTPYEIMLSESQERMLAVVLPEKWPIAKRILEKWGLQAVDVGEITDDGLLRVWGRETEADEPAEHACMPAERLADEAPVYTLPGEKPADWEKRWALDLKKVPVPINLSRTLLDLLASAEHASRQWIYEQYDHMVRTGTVYKTLGGDGCVIRIDGSKKAIAVATDSNARAASLDPRRGAMLSVAEAARNVACAGARPAAVTNNMNFGNPNRPDIFWQMEESVAGMSEACRALATPVTGGNVSLYNETDGTAIRPTLVIGMLGVLDAVEHATGIAATGDLVLLTGGGTPKLDGSSYLANIHGQVAGRPDAPDLDAERALHKFLHEAIAAGVIAAAHDVSHGGLAVTLAEMCAAGKTGMTVTAPSDARADIALFGECPGRVVITCSGAAIDRIDAIAAKNGVPVAELGSVGGERLTIGSAVDVTVREIREARARTLPRLFSA